ncbi:MAG TPA: GNAT family N-acetyltransferase [Candidatus Krumholzibacteria bacterium]|nr:GNAT family N-acetyltransferase [Candidatus Krumholzibacteria bacterium]
MLIRLATPDDAAGCLEIYRPFVESSHSTFETDVPSADAFAERVRRFLATHPWLVAVDGDRIIGYAYASPFKDRAAYQWTAEVSVYIAPDSRQRGLGRALYRALFRCMRGQGYLNAVGLIAQPNEASVALHEKMGFERVAWLPKPGFKLGRWHDVGWWWLALGPAPVAPLPPRALRDCRDEAARWIAG